MTDDKWNKQEWGVGMTAKLRDNDGEFPITGVDFQEGLVELDISSEEYPDNRQWYMKHVVTITCEGMPVPS